MHNPKSHYIVPSALQPINESQALKLYRKVILETLQTTDLTLTLKTSSLVTIAALSRDSSVETAVSPYLRKSSKSPVNPQIIRHRTLV